VKAAYLFNFPQFIEWPFERYYSPSSPFVIGVLGDDQVFAELVHSMSRKTIRGRDLRIRRFAPDQGFRDCHLLYIGISQRNQLEDVLRRLRGAPVLTVGDSADFVKAGGVIRLFVDKNRLRFEINTDAAARAGLRVSSKLLSVAWLTTDEHLGGSN